MAAFEKITLWDRKHPGAKTDSREKTQLKTDKNNDEQRKSSRYGGKKNCFNCGLPDHHGKDCPTKENGPKCFQCNERGHIAAKCPKKQEVKINCAATEVIKPKCVKEVTVNDHKIVALIDTGSDLCLMRVDQYIKLGSPVLNNKETRFRGIGSNNNVTLGEFFAKLTVDGHSYDILIRVVSDTLINHKFLIGTGF